MHEYYSRSCVVTEFLRDSHLPGAVRWNSGGYTFVAVLPRVQSLLGPVLDVASMSMGELLTSFSSALAITRLPAGGTLRVPLGGLWVLDGEEILKRYEIALILSDKQG